MMIGIVLIIELVFFLLTEDFEGFIFMNKNLFIFIIFIGIFFFIIFLLYKIKY